VTQRRSRAAVVGSGRRIVLGVSGQQTTHLIDWATMLVRPGDTIRIVHGYCAIPYAAVVGPSAMRAALSRRAVLAGAGMFFAYVLALAALQRAEAAPVAALRETSVVMAAIGAAVWGRARVPATRVLGAALVVAGVAAIALG